jgi:predicted DNA-binding transcriptional regulator AlpA
MDRNLNFLLALPKLSDEILIDVNEVASITGFSKYTIRHRRIKDFPNPLSGSHRLRWQLGHIRQWIRSSTGNNEVGSPAERNVPKGEHLWGKC